MLHSRGNSLEFFTFMLRAVIKKYLGVFWDCLGGWVERHARVPAQPWDLQGISFDTGAQR